VVDYPDFAEELEVVKSTTTSKEVTIQKQISAAEILFFQKLIRKVPVADNVLEYAVNLATKTRPNTEKATPDVNNYLSWGAGPRASQFLVLGAKCHAVLRGKYSPDIEDVRAVALPILRHRIVKNYKAEAEGIGVDDIVKKLF
jgi:MoxR-like ATPase